MATDFKDHFKTALNYVVGKKGYGAQSFYAKKAGLNQQYISLILNDERFGSEKTRRAIAEAAGYSYEDFLELGSALLKAKKTPGGHRELFRQGYKAYVDLMPTDHQEKLYADPPIDRAKFDAFLAGKYEPTENEQQKVLSGYVKGTYEFFLTFGSKHLVIGLSERDEALLKQMLAGGAAKTTSPINLNDHRKPEDLSHEEIITRFKDKEWARKISAILLEIEVDTRQKDTIGRVLSLILEHVRSQKVPQEK